MQKPEDRYSAVRNIPPRTASGPIVIKATCAEEIRRIPIVNQELTFEELCFMMHRLFRDRLSSNIQNMILKYMDEDGDLVTVTDSVDVSHALEHSNVLRITVFDKETLPLASAFTPQDLKKELKALKLTPQKTKGLKNSLLELQRQIDDLIKTYCQEEKDSEPSAMAQKPTVKESKPALSTADMADFLDNNKASSIGSGVDYSKPRSQPPPQQQQQHYDSSFDPNIRSEPPRTQAQPQPQYPTSTQQPYHSPSPQQSYYQQSPPTHHQHAQIQPQPQPQAAAQPPPQPAQGYPQGYSAPHQQPPPQQAYPLQQGYPQGYGNPAPNHYPTQRF